MSTTEAVEIEHPAESELVYRATDPAAMLFRDGEGDAPPILEGRMMPYDEWTTVRSAVEGTFMERFAPGALAKTMAERATKIRAMFEHGLDVGLGRQAIANIDELRDEADGAYYRASILHGVPDLLMSGLRHGLYGSSIRFAPVPGKWDRVRAPKASDYNPDALPEHTIREARMIEFSVVSFPQYAGATAHVRSVTDDVVTRQLLGAPDRLLEIIRTHLTTEPIEPTEPQHSEPEAPEDPAPQGSRSTQPTDYLKDEQEAEWLL